MKATFPLVLLVLALGAGRAAADTPTVYHSSNGVDPGTAASLGNTSSETLRLYIDAGSGQSDPGTACVNGGGDELCGIQVDVEVTGGGLFTAFAEDGAPSVHHPEGTTFAGSPTFSLNVLQRTSPPPAGPQFLGTLTLDNTAPEGSSITASGQVVKADLGLVNIPTRVIAVPEPAEALLLGVGILGLIPLERLRSRRQPDLGPAS